MAKSKKYQITQGDYFYGHYYAHTPQEAILKAYEKNKEFYPFDFSKPFTAKKGDKIEEVMVSA